MTHAPAVHGGAGTIRRAALTPEAEEAHRTGRRGALDAGEAVLRGRGAALNAVCAAVLTSDGGQGTGAAVTDGRDRRAGAMAGPSRPPQPDPLPPRALEDAPCDARRPERVGARPRRASDGHVDRGHDRRDAGRGGDAPSIGAGTCAVPGTGHGEVDPAPVERTLLKGALGGSSRVGLRRTGGRHLGAFLERARPARAPHRLERKDP